jgi:hypothetical protein
MAKSLNLPKGSIVTFDKGYINYVWFRLLAEKTIFLSPVSRTTPLTGLWSAAR